MSELCELLKNKEVSPAQKWEQAERLLNGPEGKANAHHCDIKMPDINFEDMIRNGITSPEAMAAAMADYYETPMGVLVQNYSGSEEEGKILKLLMEKGARPDMLALTCAVPGLSASEDLAALHYCAMKGQRKLLEIIIQHHGDSYALTEKNEFSPLQLAAKNGDVETIKLLINVEKPMKHHRDRWGKTAANYTRKKEILDLLKF